jgi:hypothetical protein
VGERDLVLGSALAELDVPDYPLDFLAGVWARVDAEAASAGNESVGSATGAGRLRLPRPSRSLWFRRPVLAAAIVATVTAAVTAAVLIGLPGLSRVTGPEPVSAAEVIQKALRALSEAETVQADCTGKLMTALRSDGTAKYVVEHSRQLMRSDGSFRYTLTDKPQTIRPLWARTRDDARITAYDAVHGVYRDYFVGWDPEAGRDGRHVSRYEVTTGYPLGEPDYSGWDESATGRALLAAGKATLATTTFEGRPVWELTIDTSAAAGVPLPYDETAVITVDQETCLPIGIRLTRDGVVMMDTRWRNVRVDEPLPDGLFRFDPPEGARVVRRDAGFKRVPLDAISSAVDHDLLVPTWLPEGYVLQWTAVADRLVTEEGPNSGRDVVHLQYVRGFDALTITTRIADDPKDAADYDPIGEWSWSDLMRRDVELTEGAFAGVTARVVVGPWISSPHLYLVEDGILLTVAGGATADELVAIAESLQPYRQGSASSPAGPGAPASAD